MSMSWRQNLACDDFYVPEKGDDLEYSADNGQNIISSLSKTSTISTLFSQWLRQRSSAILTPIEKYRVKAMVPR